jgi:hypothetical protein
MIKNLGGFTGGKNFRSKSELKRKAIQKKNIPGSLTGSVNGSYRLPQTKKTAKGGGINAIRKNRKGKLKT